MDIYLFIRTLFSYNIVVSRACAANHKNRKIKRGEFITPPRPTGRRSNYSRIFASEWLPFPTANVANTAVSKVVASLILENH